MDGKSGSFECVEWTEKEKDGNPTRRGFVQVCRSGPRPERYFEYNDGTPFLWIADTWWNWTVRGIRDETFQRLVDDRVAKGFSIGQLFVPGNGWSERSSILDSSYRSLDIEHMRLVEERIRYANSRGMTMWVHGWWSREGNAEKIGEENVRRWWRYLLHRLGAYNVIWILAGEYNLRNYGGFKLEFWKDLGTILDREDPYERIISVHPTPPNWQGGKDAPQWSTSDLLHHEPWLDYNQSQIGHEQYRNELVPVITARDYALEPPKPHVQSECWYENYMGCTGEDIRFAAWSSMLSGAAGHTYGSNAGMTALVEETYQKRPDRPVTSDDFMMNTLDLDGAVGMGRMARFFRSIEWWRLEPHPELLEEYPGRYCAANPGEEYVIYLRWGGNVLLNLSGVSETNAFHVRCLNPRTGVFEADYATTVYGGSQRRLFAPGKRDWVLHLARTT